MEYKKTMAAWIRKDKNGNEYLSVVDEQGKWHNLFKNTKKEAGSKAPDWKPITKKPDDFGPEPKFNDKEDIPF